MDSARSVAFRQVEGGLRVLVWTTALSVALYVIQPFVYRLLFDLSADAGSLSGGLLPWGMRAFQLAWLGIGAAKIAGAAPLARLPGPRVTEGRLGPYRGAPDAREASPARPLAPALLLLLSATFALGLAGEVLFEVSTARRLDEGPGLSEAVWALWLAVDLAALVVLALWAVRAARGAGAALPTALPIAAVAIGAARAALVAVQMLGPKEVSLREPMQWLLGLGMVAEGVSVCALVWLVLRVVRAEAREDEEASALAGEALGRRRAPPEDAPLWLDMASAVRGYATAVKVRLGALAAGYALLVGSRLWGEQELSRVLVLLPIVAAVIGVVMVLLLVRLIRVPASVGGDAPALVGLILVLLASFADFYAFSLMLDLLSDRVWKAFDAREELPYVEVFSQALSLGALLSLLTLFRRIARHLCDAELDRRCGALAALLGALMVAAIVVRVAFENRVKEAVLLLGPLLLLGVVVALRRYLWILRDVQGVMEQHAREGGDGPAVGA